ncbi:MAG: substrate-binding domain-containing protein [Firmicutes bacterium]|nr:substrate-binding domain-containing protein [Bacillota bacterium]
MKKLLALALALVMVLGMVGCGEAEPEEKTVKVGIAAPDVTHGWVAGVAYYAEKYCKDNNIDYKMTVSSDAAEMTSNLQDLVADGCTVVVSWPQWTGMETALQEVIDEDIPVVNFDVDVDCEGIYKVTGDNYDMGYRCAEYITETVGDAANIVVMDVPSSGSVCELRKEGFYDYLEEKNYDTTNIVEYQLESFARDDGLAAMADILEANPEIDAVFSMDDETSIGCIQAIRDANRTDIKAITGGGGCQEYFRMINDEAYADLGLATALYSPSMVQDAIKTAITLLNGGEAEPVVVIPTTIVKADNVKDYLDENNTVY